MNILGFNPSHHSSVCLLEDGEIKYFIEDERISKSKYGLLPFKTITDIIKNTSIDFYTWGTPSIYYLTDSCTKYISDSYWIDLFFSYGHQKSVDVDFSYKYHHLLHASNAFYNSGFTKSLSVVIDGMGSLSSIPNSNIPGEMIEVRETETIYECSYPNNFKVINKNLTHTDTTISIARSYEVITEYLGWGNNEAGKTMGLFSYGKPNHNIPNMLMYLDYNRGVFKYNPNLAEVDSEKNPQLKLQTDPKEWHHNESKITNLEKDLAWRVQNDTQQLVGDYIEKSIQETGLNQVCCAGGYFLNCVANYYLTKRFPDVEFYFEPIANDAGTAIGAAKLVWHTETKDMTIRPLKSLYLGKQYSKEELLEGIKNYTND